VVWFVEKNFSMPSIICFCFVCYFSGVWWYVLSSMMVEDVELLDLNRWCCNSVKMSMIMMILYCRRHEIEQRHVDVLYFDFG
jgi:hypothetical protein